MRCWPITTSLPSIGSTCGHRTRSRALSRRSAIGRSAQGLPLEQDRACHGLQLVEGAQKSWRKLDGHHQLPKIIQGVTFIDGLETAANLKALKPHSPPPDPSGHHQKLAIAPNREVPCLVHRG